MVGPGRFITEKCSTYENIFFCFMFYVPKTNTYSARYAVVVKSHMCHKKDALNFELAPRRSQSDFTPFNK